MTVSKNPNFDPAPNFDEASFEEAIHEALQGVPIQTAVHNSALRMDEPFDAKVSPMLDEALRAPAVPVDLAHRIFASTRDQLVKANAHWTRRLGPIWLRRANAMAAGIVLAGSAAVLLVGSGILRDAHDTVTAKADIALLGEYEGMQTQLDQEILQLALKVQDVSDYTYIDTDAARTVSALEAIIPARTNSNGSTPANSQNQPGNESLNSLF